MNEHEIAKGLEVWTLQTLINASILMGLLSSGIILAHSYRRDVEKRFGLRLSQEAWRGAMIAAPDLLLTGVALIGFLALNPDVMSDAKIALPFYPMASLFFTAALILRVLKGGHDVAAPSFLRALKLTLAGNLLNIIGFAFVSEGASDEYLASHPSAFWLWIRTHLRSNADPHGLEWAQVCFSVGFPILVALGLWAVRAGFANLDRTGAGDAL